MANQLTIIGLNDSYVEKIFGEEVFYEYMKMYGLDQDTHFMVDSYQKFGLSSLDSTVQELPLENKVIEDNPDLVVYLGLRPIVGSDGKWYLESISQSLSESESDSLEKFAEAFPKVNYERSIDMPLLAGSDSPIRLVLSYAPGWEKNYVNTGADFINCLCKAYKLG